MAAVTSTAVAAAKEVPVTNLRRVLDPSFLKPGFLAPSVAKRRVTALDFLQNCGHSPSGPETGPPLPATAYRTMSSSAMGSPAHRRVVLPACGGRAPRRAPRRA